MLDHWRASARSLVHRPGLSATVIATLALGIGANSAIFSAIDAVLLKPLPYPAADRLVSVYERNTGLRQATQLVAPGRLEEWNGQNRTFDGLAASYFENMTDASGALPERVEAMRTSPRFFAVLGVMPALGRLPSGDEERFGGPAIAVVSNSFWRRRLNGDPSAVGRRLTLASTSRTIIAVMPPAFRYPTATTEVWLPTQAPEVFLGARAARLYTAIGRLKEGTTLAQAQADLDAVEARLGEQYPATDRGWGATLVPLKEQQIGGVRRSLWLLLGAVSLVLLAACGNVACLMLADATRRQHEVAVRFALGADRVRVVRQLLSEGVLLAIAGAALGLVIAASGLSLLRVSGGALTQLRDVTVDIRLVTFTLIVGVATTLAFALVPALQATARGPSEALVRGGRGQVGGRQRLARTLVAGQVALAIVLLSGAGLLVRSFAQMQDVNLGLDARGVLTFRMSAQWSERPAAVVQRLARTIDRLNALPGVEAAAFSQALPAGIDIPPSEFHIIGRDEREKTFATGRAVSSGYFRTLHIPILEGDTCSSDPAAPLFGSALVTRAFADRYFPDGPAVGQLLRGPGQLVGQTTTIVGVAGNVRESGALKNAEPLIYWCGSNPYWPDPYFLVETRSEGQAALTSIRAAMREIEPQRAIYAVQPLTDSLTESLAQRRLTTLLLSAFAATALLLAAMGLYGVLSQLVSARRREIGVRMALGAQAAQILASVMGDAAIVAGAGIAAGLAAALGLTRYMSMLLFGVTARDPVTFVLVPIVLISVAAIAALIPARRASRVDPMDALRDG